MKAKRSVSRIVFAKLDEATLSSLKQALADPKVSWSIILEKFPAYTQRQLRNFAQGESISLQKGRRARAVDPSSETEKMNHAIAEALADPAISWPEIFKRFPERTENQLRGLAKHRGISIRKGRRGSVIAAQTSSEDEDKSSAKKEKEPFEYSPFGPTKWPAPDVIQISKEAWDRPGKRVAYFSRIDFQAEGHRRGILRLEAQLAVDQGMHFPVFAGGLVSHRWFTEREKQLFGLATSREDRFTAHAKLVEETVEGISSVIPEIRDPEGKLVRWYVMASRPRAYDGPYGDEILRRLERMRPDIRKNEEGGERIEIKDARLVEDLNKNGVVVSNHLESIYHGVVLPKAGRLPSRYMSTFAEREIADVEAQTSKDYPALWVVPGASALYKPSGEREVAYITVPASRKLEAKEQRIAENQSGFSVVEEMLGGDRFVHDWNLRDLIAHERDFIGMKEGAQKVHKDIVDVLKREGRRTPGQIADVIGLDSESVRREIAFLVQDRPSASRTWPGLRYNEAADQYDFHGDWIRRNLRYGWPDESDTDWHEDSFLLLGCMHAGYTSADYAFVVKTIPEKMIAYGIKTLVGAGDFIAGLYHHLRDKGEVLGLSYTQQEVFAAQLVATILIKVFRVRFEAALEARGNYAWNADEVHALVSSTLPLFPFIKGNHDRWQDLEGHSALMMFHEHLLKLLRKYVRQAISSRNLPPIDVDVAVEDRVLFLDNPFRPIFDLSSGVRCAVIHPEMGRAGSSLRLEKEIERFSTSKYKCNVVFVANFHTAIHAHKWNPIVGQCVGVQQGATLLGTDFEFKKTKQVDFGVQMLKVFSFRGRIMKTTVASFNTPLMAEPYSPGMSVDTICEKLGILR